MSAFVVSKHHIDAMVQAGLPSNGDGLSWYHEGEWHRLDLTNASEVGAMLWAENVASVGYRYSPPGRIAIYGDDLGKDADSDMDLPGTYKTEDIGGVAVEMPEWAEPYAYEINTRSRTPVEILRAISCYEYQSCEHDDWDESEAKAYCEALRHEMIRQLPGYADAPREINA